MMKSEGFGMTLRFLASGLGIDVRVENRKKNLNIDL